MAIYKSKFTGQEIDDILTNASNVTNIEANPSGEATEDLTKITIGDTTYSIPEGTVVEGNPSGDATVELTKLKVGDTIYSVPQGGGGGGALGLYKHTVEALFGPSEYGTYILINDRSSPYTTINDFLHDYGAVTFGDFELIDGDGIPSYVPNAVVGEGYRNGYVVVYCTTNSSSTTLSIKHIGGCSVTDTVTAI